MRGRRIGLAGAALVVVGILVEASTHRLETVDRRRFEDRGHA